MGPAGFDGVRAGIQGYDLVFILDIVVNHALAISHGVLGPATHGDCRYTTVAVAASITEALLLFPFIVKICLEAGS